MGQRVWLQPATPRSAKDARLLNIYMAAPTSACKRTTGTGTAFVSPQTLTRRSSGAYLAVKVHLYLGGIDFVFKAREERGGTDIVVGVRGKQAERTRFCG